MAELGIGLSSGDAIRADQAFYRGACLQRDSANTEERVPLNRIYLAWDGIGGRRHDPENGWYAAPFYKETYEQATQLALEARGSFEGLTRGGIGQHVRNVYQIHGHMLTEPVIAMWYWGIPVGKSEKVRGGTNTALQLAKKAMIPNRFNLNTDEGMEKAIRFLARYESSKPYPKDLLVGVALERS
jgi:hypothetical protein